MDRDPREVRAEVEAEYGAKAQELKASAQKLKNDIDASLSTALRELRKGREQAMLDAGLSSDGPPTQPEREKPEYFNRHRVTAPAE